MTIFASAPAWLGMSFVTHVICDRCFALTSSDVSLYRDLTLV